MEDVVTHEHADYFIEITVSEPQKVGEGMGSYLAYKYVLHFTIFVYIWINQRTHNHNTLFFLSLCRYEQSLNAYKHSKIQGKTIQYTPKI